jgi:hypothetical protein
MVAGVCAHSTHQLLDVGTNAHSVRGIRATERPDVEQRFAVNPSGSARHDPPPS